MHSEVSVHRLHRLNRVVQVGVAVSDMELQAELLTEADLTLESAEKKAVAKESAKYSQAVMSGEDVSRLKSNYNRS